MYKFLLSLLLLSTYIKPMVRLPAASLNVPDSTECAICFDEKPCDAITFKHLALKMGIVLDSECYCTAVYCFNCAKKMESKKTKRCPTCRVGPRTSPSTLSSVQAFERVSFRVRRSIANSEPMAVTDLSRLNSILESGRDINERDDMDWTPLMSACYHGYEYIVRRLLEYPNILINEHTSHRAPLQISVTQGYTNIAKMLLARPDIYVNLPAGIVDKRAICYTPLMRAAEQGNSEIVRLILAKRNINIDCKLEGRTSAFDLAMRNNHFAIARLILAKKISRVMRNSIILCGESGRRISRHRISDAGF